MNAWSDWQPKREIAKKFKEVVENIEERARQEVDDAAFAKGKSAPETRRPKLKRKRKQPGKRQTTRKSSRKDRGKHR